MNRDPQDDFPTLTVAEIISIRSKGDSFACTANNAKFRKVIGGRAYCSCCKQSVDEIADFLPSYQICRVCWDATLPNRLDPAPAAPDLLAVLDKTLAAVWDSYYGKGISLEYVRSVDAEARAAIAKARA